MLSYRHFRYAQRLSAFCGGLAALVAIKVMLLLLHQQNLEPTMVFAAVAALLLLLGVVLPWGLMGMLWRWWYRRHEVAWR